MTKGETVRTATATVMRMRRTTGRENLSELRMALRRKKEKKCKWCQYLASFIERKKLSTYIRQPNDNGMLRQSMSPRHGRRCMRIMSVLFGCETIQVRVCLSSIHAMEWLFVSTEKRFNRIEHMALTCIC